MEERNWEEKEGKSVINERDDGLQAKDWKRLTSFLRQHYLNEGKKIWKNGSLVEATHLLTRGEAGEKC